MCEMACSAASFDPHPGSASGTPETPYGPANPRNRELSVGRAQLPALLRGALKHADLAPDRNVLQLQRSPGLEDG
jgi:hypothetical protein